MSDYRAMENTADQHMLELGSFQGRFKDPDNSRMSNCPRRRNGGKMRRETTSSAP